MANINALRSGNSARVIDCALASLTVAALVGVLSLTVLVGIVISVSVISIIISVIRIRKKRTAQA